VVNAWMIVCRQVNHLDIELSLIQLFKFAQIVAESVFSCRIQNMCVCMYVCMWPHVVRHLPVKRLLQQQQQTNRPSGVANAPCLNCHFLLAIACTLVAALVLQLSWHRLRTSIISVIISSLTSAVTGVWI